MLVRTFHFRRARCRSGQALVEFAVVALVLTFLVAGVLTFGFALFGANVLQQAADVGAMELARVPLEPLTAFPYLGSDSSRTSTDPSMSVMTDSMHKNIWADPDVRNDIFDERYLLVRQSDLGSATVTKFLADKPLINRLLSTLFIVETVPLDGAPELIFRFPGTIVQNTSTGQYTVLIPVSTGGDSYEWHAVVEEIRRPDSPTSPTAWYGPLSIQPPGAPSDMMTGMVAIRINYPYQSGAMVQYRYELGGKQATLPQIIGANGVQNIPVVADDATVVLGTPPAPYELVVPENYVYEPGNSLSVGNSADSGEYGFGRMYAMGIAVRPYRKVITAQAIYRREVFE